VRVPVMAVMLTLGLAAPARAVPITTLQFSGVINAVSGTVSTFVAPSLSVGDPFLITIDFGEFLEPQVSFSLGNSITGRAWCSLCSAPFSAAMPATSLYMQSGPVLMPPTQWPGGYQSLFTMTLASGWQSGSTNIWLENAFLGGPVTGTITGSTRVAEPATALLLSIGVACLARRRSKSSRS